MHKITSCLVALLLGCLPSWNVGAAAGTSQGIDVDDSRGRRVRFDSKPMRIASGSLVSDQILFELLSQAGELGRLAAVSYLADDPQYSYLASSVKGVKGRVGLSVEGLLGLKPDLVILASFNRPELLRQLEGARVTTFLIDQFTSFSDIVNHILKLSALVGLPGLGQQQAAALQEKIAAQQAICQKRRSAQQPPPKLMFWHPDGTTEGAGTMFNDLVRLVGGDNPIARLGAQGWPRLSPEVLAGLDADWIVMLGQQHERQRLLGELTTTASLRHMTASKKGQLIVLDPADYNAFSARMLVSLGALAEAVCSP